MRENQLLYRLDWLTIAIYFALVIGGWLSIYAAEYDPDINNSIFNFSTSAGRQFVWITTSVGLITFIMLLDFRIYDTISYFVYGGMVLLLIAVLFFGKEVAGSKSWFGIGSFEFQPSEFAKFAVCLALARYFSKSTRKTSELNVQIIGFLIFVVPLALVVLQGDAGTAIVFASLVIVLFKEGMHPIFLIGAIGVAVLFILTLLLNQLVLIICISAIAILIIGLVSRSLNRIVVTITTAVVAIAFVFSVDFILTEVLKPHQQKRVMSLVNPNADPLGIGWNVTQSKIAIGSGGWFGKGYLEGTQTKFDFVPKQTTDFIFSTIGEEQGWIGSVLLIAAFTTLLVRLVFLANRQKSAFARIYGYGVTSILFIHFALNIAMTIGLFPVIGIPLPFFSYGGSSLWGFTLLLFVFIKLDAHRMQVLQRM